MSLEDDDWCFGCGDENPIGLHLHFTPFEDGVIGTFTPQRNHQGYRNMLHGGLMITLLDEAIAWAITNKYGYGATGEINIRIRQSGEIGVPLTITAKAGRKRMRMVEGEAKVTDPNGTVIAEATSKFMLSESSTPLPFPDKKNSIKV